jgi:long-chain acyl-CoA synthetase
MFEISVKRYPQNACFTIYENGRKSLNYTEALAVIKGVAGHLANMGCVPGTAIAVTGKNSPEWAVAYMAALFAGCVVVPIDHQLRKEETELLIRTADAKVLFCDEEKFDLMDERALGLKAKFSLSTEKTNYIYDLKADYAKAQAQAQGVKDGDLAAILFTSGTTGVPKGVMLTHANLVADCYLAQANLTIYSTDVFYALLPIHHAYTMLAVFIEAMSVGAEIVFAKRMAIGQILRDFKEAQVTMFLGVPLLFNKLLSGIMGKIKAKGPIVYGIIRFLMAISGLIKKATGINPGKHLFKSILDQASLSSLRICISGGGPLAPAVFADWNKLGIDFVQGYGLTETSPIVALNPKEHYKPTSVGKKLPNMEMKLIDIDGDGNGEIVMKGPMIMQGYYKNEQATKDTFTEDGWFKSGDVGSLDSEGYLYLTGRAKNMIVTEGGKNVYPEEVENAFQLYYEVDQVMVRGFLLDKATKSEGIEALIFPSKDFFEDLEKKEAKKYGEAEIHEHFARVVAEVNLKLLPYQRIGRFTILKQALDMTSTKKVKRFTVGENLGE